MSSNPTLDRFWREFKAIEPTAEFGGIDANKPGYHEKRDDLWWHKDAQGNYDRRDDYSVAHVAADRRGSGSVSSAIDLTMWPAGGPAMRKYTNRLKTAARDRDPRLWLRGGPTLREFIGTDDGQRVYCYVFTGGVPLGVNGDSGPDWGRPDSHLWHIHLSIIRQYAEDWPALDAVLSVLKGESLAAWRARTEDDMATTAENQIAWIDGRVEAISKGTPAIADGRPGAGQPVWIVGAVKGLTAAAAEQRLRDEAILAAVRDDADRDAILARVDERAAQLAAEVNEVPGETVEALGAVESAQEIADRLRAVLGDKAAEVGQLLAAG